MEDVKIWEELVVLILNQRRAAARYRHLCQALDDPRHRATCRRVAEQLESVSVNLQREFRRLYLELDLDALMKLHRRPPEG